MIFVLSFSATAHDLHIPLDLTFEESQKWYASFKHELNKKNAFSDSNIEAAIEGGEILGKWLEKINATRASNPIRLTSKATRRGIPVDKPSKYGPKTIKEKYEEFGKEMPKVLYDVYYGNAQMTATIPVSDDEFIKWGREVSKLYQTAVRWTGHQRWIDYYANRRFDDVRGYYALKEVKELDQKLLKFATLSTAEKEALKEGLLGICLNTRRSETYCEREFELRLKRNSLLNMKNAYWAKSVKLWNSFFEISNPRTDVVWNARNPYVMNIPFIDPKNNAVATWLKENVEDEFKRGEFSWQMVMDYVTTGSGTARIEFKAGVTPHVSGGNLVVMDANTSLEEYSEKWTIRHEFGHILRLPDCYVEFYVPSENLMVNYQLDITDLMCSRAGDMNDRIYHELKKVYFKK